MMKYQEIEILIDQLHYLWTKVEGNSQQNKKWLELYDRIEKNIRCEKFVFLHKGMTQDEKDQIKVQYVGESLKKLGMINPLWVVKVAEGVYIVLRGNQRLCWRRSQDYKGQLRCIVSSSWDTRELQENCPYTIIEYEPKFELENHDMLIINSSIEKNEKSMADKM